MVGQPTPRTVFHEMVYSTTRISIQQPNGNTIAGTAFFYRTEVPLSGERTQSNLLIISNKHVLEDGHNGLVTLRLNRARDDGTPDYGNPHYFHIENLSERYIPHPDPEVDLACVPIEDLPTFTYARIVSPAHLADINHEIVRPGSDVWFVGYPTNYYDVVNNLPLVRRGSLASLPEVDFNGKGHLVIDAQVFPGSSGSPVYVDSGGDFRLLGVIESAVQTINTGGIPLPIGLGQLIKQKQVRQLIDHANNQLGRIMSAAEAALQRFAD